MNKHHAIHFHFSALSHSREKRLWLLHVCPFECLCACISSAPTERIVVKFDIGDIESVAKLQIWLKSDKNIGNFTL
jgi:hypothetical protein